MIIVDTRLKEREESGQPIGVCLYGAGFVGRALTRQIIRFVPGMTVSVICNRTLDHARKAFLEAGVAAEDIIEAESAEAINQGVESGKYCVTQNVEAAAAAGLVDVVLEVTGQIEYGALACMAAKNNGKHVILVNAELDATIGPVLKHYADRAGVIISGCDGDQPGALLNLHRFVAGLGMKPLICGNIKGLQDHYRTPETQAGFARQWGQNAKMVTSFADGTKISCEQAIVANATGMKVARRGMIGLHHQGHVDEMLEMYDYDAIREMGGIVDYVVGARPGPGVFVFAEAREKEQAVYLEYCKMGQGPVYSFYTPYHIPFFEIPISAARAVLLGDAVIAPRAGPLVEVVAMAKCDLKAGERLDGLGGFHAYGQCENHDTARREGLLPIGLGEGCLLLRDVPKDAVLKCSDVALREESIATRLWRESQELF